MADLANDEKEYGPDRTTAPERKFESTSGREHDKEILEQQYIDSLDSEIKKVRTQIRKKPIIRALKWIGIVYIFLSIIKGIYLEFSPLFDLIGLGFVILALIVERVNISKAEKEFKKQAHDEEEIVYGNLD